MHYSHIVHLVTSSYACLQLTLSETFSCPLINQRATKQGAPLLEQVKQPTASIPPLFKLLLLPPN
jgi:hypothetical protein